MVKRARNSTIEKFLRARGGNAASNIQKRIDSIHSAVLLTTDHSGVLGSELFTLIYLCASAIALIDSHSQ